MPEFFSIREASALREARWMERLARAVTHLLSPHLKAGTDPAGIIQGILGGDPQSDILQARKRRLETMRKRSE